MFIGYNFQLFCDLILIMDINYLTFISANNKLLVSNVSQSGGEDPYEMDPNVAYQGPSDAEARQQLQTSVYSGEKLNYMEPSKTNLYTIPRGTILYHGTLYKESFNPFDIRLGEDKLVSYFSPNKRLAADYIVGCALYPTRSGFIHKFRVKKDIKQIMIISTFEKKPNWTLSFIEETFCSRKFRIQLDGIGFFFPRRDDDNSFTNSILGDNISNDPQISFDAEFAICNPNEYLEYISTERCMSMRKLGTPYHFNK
jgi:hypothetical protein